MSKENNELTPEQERENLIAEIKKELKTELRAELKKEMGLAENSELKDEVEYLKMQLAELTGKSVGLPKVKPVPDFSYAEEHDVEHFIPTAIDSNMQGVSSSAKQLIPNRVILKPTKENPHHEQGKEFECDSRLAEDHIRRGFAVHVRTKEEDDKLKSDKLKAESKKK